MNFHKATPAQAHDFRIGDSERSQKLRLRHGAMLLAVAVAAAKREARAGAPRGRKLRPLERAGRRCAVSLPGWSHASYLRRTPLSLIASSLTRVNEISAGRLEHTRKPERTDFGRHKPKDAKTQHWGELLNHCHNKALEETRPSQWLPPSPSRTVGKTSAPARFPALPVKVRRRRQRLEAPFA